MEATITSAQYSYSFHCFIQKMLALTTVVTSCGLLSMFLSFSELLRCFVWEGIDISQKEQLAVYRRNNLQFTGSQKEQLAIYRSILSTCSWLSLGLLIQMEISVADLRGILLIHRKAGMFAWWLILVPSFPALASYIWVISDNIS